MGEGIEISLPLWPPFFGVYAHVGVFSGKLKTSDRYMYHSSKIKTTRERVDSRVHFVWRLQVNGLLASSSPVD